MFQRTWKHRVVRLAMTIPLLIAAAAGFFQAAKAWLRVDQYRFEIAQKLQEATGGLPIVVGQIDMRLFPSLHLRVSGASARTAWMRLSIGEMTFLPELKPLLRREAHIRDIRIASLDINMTGSADSLSGNLQGLRRTRGKAPSAPRDWRISVDRIRCENVRIGAANGESARATGNIEISNLTRGITIGKANLRFTEPFSGRLRAQLSARRDAATGRLSDFEGEASLFGVDVSALPPFRLAPSARIDATAAFRGNFQGSGEAVISGRTLSGNDVPPSATGPFTASAAWDKKSFSIRNVVFQSPGIEASGDAAWQPGGAANLRIASLHLNALGLAPLLDIAATSRIYLTPTPAAHATASEWSIELAPNSRPRFLSGAASFEGVQLSLRDGEMLVPAIQGSFTVDNGDIRLRDASGEGIAASGIVLPDAERGEIFLQIEASVNLAHTRLFHLYPIPGLDRLHGKLAVEKLAGTFRRGQTALPDDFNLQASIRAGEATLRFPSYQDVLSEVTADLSGDARTLKGNVSGRSAEFGSVEASGALQLSPLAFTGVISGDMSHPPLSFLKDHALHTYLPSLLSGYGPSAFETTLTYRNAEENQAFLSIRRATPPDLSAELTFVQEPEGWRTTSARLLADASLTPLNGKTPGWIKMEGPARLTLVTDPVQQTFSAKADLANASWSLADTLIKPAGETASIIVTGTTPRTGWRSANLQIAILDQRIDGVFQENGRVRFESPGIDLGAWASLYARGLKITGKASGWAQTSPLEIQLAFDGVGASISPHAAVDAVTGSIQWNNGRWTFGPITARGIQSDIRFSGTLAQHKLSGQAAGAHLDINALVNFINDVADWIPAHGPKTSETPPSPQPPAFEATIRVGLDAATYRRARFENVTGTVAIEGTRTRIQNLSCIPYKGAAGGSIDIQPRSGELPGQAHVDVTMDNADAKGIDDLLFAKPRGLTGRVTGAINMTIPIDDNPIHGVNGTAHGSATKGTLGKLGLSTRMLSFIRTTDVLRLKAPPLKDEGLVFDDMTLSLTFADGILILNSSTLVNPVLSLAATGAVDFPKDASALRIHVVPFQSIGGLLDRIPVVGLAFDDIRRLSRFSLDVTGPPDAPTIRLVDPFRLLSPKTANPSGSADAPADRGLLGDVLHLPGDMLRSITGR